MPDSVGLNLMLTQMARNRLINRFTSLNLSMACTIKPSPRFRSIQGIS